jgi:hypothetical protein
MSSLSDKRTISDIRVLLSLEHHESLLQKFTRRIDRPVASSRRPISGNHREAAAQWHLNHLMIRVMLRFASVKGEGSPANVTRISSIFERSAAEPALQDMQLFAVNFVASNLQHGFDVDHVWSNDWPFQQGGGWEHQKGHRSSRQTVQECV